MKNNLKLFKKNLSVIILIPTILGGFWQFIALSNISISYIRFFSISQLIADGILLLFLLTLIYLSYKFSTWVTNEGLKNQIESKGHKIFKFSFLIIIGLVCIIMFIKDTVKTGYINPLGLTFSIVFVTIIFVIFKHLLLSLKIIQSLIKMKTLLLIITILFIFSLVYFIELTFSAFNKSFLIPKNLKNIGLIEKKLHIKYPNSTSITIKYFNDKYFFVEINQNNKSEIEIISFDKLFE